MLGPTASFVGKLNADTFNGVLMQQRRAAPDNTIASALTAYNTGQWTAATNEVIDATNWVAAAGRCLAWRCPPRVSTTPR